jgi:co-chaperonin GroES (HSP10)
MNNVYPINKKFIVEPDEGEDRTESGIFLTEKTPKFTGTVKKLPAGVVAIDTATETEYEKDAEIKAIGPGRLIQEGTRIQWSSQSGFAVPISITDKDYLLFTIFDVDLILEDG